MQNGTTQGYTEHCRVVSILSGRFIRYTCTNLLQFNSSAIKFAFKVYNVVVDTCKFNYKCIIIGAVFQNMKGGTV